MSECIFSFSDCKQEVFVIKHNIGDWFSTFINEYKTDAPWTGVEDEEMDCEYSSNC
jgi:hypothetical protein